jgi:hypothetical protein
MNLPQRDIHGWDGAQRVGGQHTVHQSIRQRELGTIAPYPLDRRPPGRLPRPRESHCRLRGLDDQDFGHLSRIVMEIETGAETDLQYATLQTPKTLARRAFTVGVFSTRYITRGKT